MSGGAAPVSSPRSVVASLTDEEIDVLCDGAHDVVVLPHLSMLDEGEARIARRVAERSLAARGLLLPLPDGHQVAGSEKGTTGDEGVSAGPAPDEAGWTVAVHDLLAPVLQMRRGAPVVVVLHRTPTSDLTTLDLPRGTDARPGLHPPPQVPVSTGPGTGAELTRYLFVLDGTLVCEDVTDQGVHTLSVGLAEHLATVLAEFLVPPGSCDAQGAQTTVADPTDLPRTLRRLGHPVVLVEATVLHPWRGPGQAPARLLSLGPGGCFQTDLGQERRWVCRPSSPGELVSDLVDEIAAATRQVAEELSDHNGGRD